MQRGDFLNRIKLNIAENGYHVTLVADGELPRFAYTIGCTDTLGAEFLFAGGEFYSKDDVSTIIRGVTSLVATGVDWNSIILQNSLLGDFRVAKADNSWSKLLALGVFDYYNRSDVSIWQIVPDIQHHTLDVPDTSKIFDAGSEPVWQWLSRKWDYPIPKNSVAFTDLPVLFGKEATEVMRWETGEWEIFSEDGNAVPKEDRRVVALGTLLGIDSTLEAAVSLDIGKGLWRDSVELVWNDWG